jgi:thiamine pyrophosphate-dependent acetolactate synthase large subunit-like protein
MCRQCNAPVEQFIIPPVAHKYLTHPPIVQVWDRGRKTLEEAKLFVIIGYSFADADDYIAKMLVKSVGQSPDKNIVVIDIDEKAINRCRTFIKLHVDAFDDKKKFFPICGDALHLVPRVLDALSDGKKTEKSKK